MYILTTFDGVTLPTASPRLAGGTAESVQRMVRLAGGGVYDAHGTAQALAALPQELTYSCKALGSTATELRATLDALRGKRGVRGRLYRRGLNDGGLQWALARLLQVDATTEAQHSHGLFQPISLRWSLLTLWQGGVHGAGWTLNSGQVLDGGLYLDMKSQYILASTSTTAAPVNYGNAATEDVTLTYTAGGSNCTGLTIRCGDCELVFGGTVLAGKSLVIDCGARSVRNDGADAYAALTLGANHASAAWMRLAPGANAMTVTRVGGGTGSVLTVGFWDGWE